jgi:hypothetical protein
VLATFCTSCVTVVTAWPTSVAIEPEPELDDVPEPGVGLLGAVGLEGVVGLDGGLDEVELPDDVGVDPAETVVAAAVCGAVTGVLVAGAPVAGCVVGATTGAVATVVVGRGVTGIVVW